MFEYWSNHIVKATVEIIEVKEKLLLERATKNPIQNS